MAKKTETTKKVKEVKPIKEEIVSEVIAPEIVEVKTEEVKKNRFLGTLGLSQVVRLGKKTIQGREYNEVLCAEGTTYLLNDSDLAKQYKSK